MADNSNGVDDAGSDSNSRATPFQRAELVEMVRYLAKRKYEDSNVEPAYKRKTAILQRLSRKLSKKFGTNRSARQIQKRFSDLKICQSSLLRNIYEEILLTEDSSLDNDEIVSALEACSTSNVSETSDNPPNNEIQETKDNESTITLTLETVSDLESPIEISSSSTPDSVINPATISLILLKINNVEILLANLSAKIDAILQALLASQST